MIAVLKDQLLVILQVLFLMIFHLEEEHVQFLMNSSHIKSPYLKVLKHTSAFLNIQDFLQQLLLQHSTQTKLTQTPFSPKISWPFKYRHSHMSNLSYKNLIQVDF